MRDRLADRRDGAGGARLDVLLDHLAEVHAVDVVGAHDDDDVGLLVVDEVEALVDRVGAAEVPVLVDALLRGHGRDVVAEQRRHAPRLRHVRVEAVRLVLRQHDDLEVAGVDDVGQREVDEAVDPGERHGRFGAVGGQRHQPLALTSREHDREDFRTTGWASSGHERHPRAKRPSARQVQRAKIGRAFRAAGCRAGLGSERARRHPQQGVPAGHLRRRGCSRGRARPGAARARRHRRAGALLRRRRATRRARRRMPTCRSSRRPTPRCRPSASTSAWPATASAPTSSTRTRGTPTWPATSRRSSAVCRTS